MADFYTNFVQQCSKKGVSPSAAAEAVGLSRSAPVGWKKGAMPRDTAINMLADYFGCSVSDLTSRTKLTLGGKADFKSTDDINDSVLSNLPQREQMRQEMRILFDAAEDAPTSAILEAAALLMRYKENSK